MQEESKYLAEGGEAIPSAPRSVPRGAEVPSILLHSIQDQQIYLSLTSTLLRLAAEAGAPAEALQQVAGALRSARGCEGPSMLATLNQQGGVGAKRRESYNFLERGTTVEEERALLAKLEKDMLEAREKQNHFRSLVKYRCEKSEEIAPSVSGCPNSRKERFRRLLREGSQRRWAESSDFYKFEVSDILQNSFKLENECYRTLGCFSHLKTMFGHASDADIETYSQIFNAILDRSEELILTGGEEGTIKVWHRASGTLIANLRGTLLPTQPTPTFSTRSTPLLATATS
jgi:hypothetical protein